MAALEQKAQRQVMAYCVEKVAFSKTVCGC
jgi:hypothetical protein